MKESAGGEVFPPVPAVGRRQHRTAAVRAELTAARSRARRAHGSQTSPGTRGCDGGANAGSAVRVCIFTPFTQIAPSVENYHERKQNLSTDFLILKYLTYVHC